MLFKCTSKALNVLGLSDILKFHMHFIHKSFISTYLCAIIHVYLRLPMSWHISRFYKWKRQHIFLTPKQLKPKMHIFEQVVSIFWMACYWDILLWQKRNAIAYVFRDLENIFQSLEYLKGKRHALRSENVHNICWNTFNLVSS